MTKFKLSQIPQGAIIQKVETSVGLNIYDEPTLMFEVNYLLNGIEHKSIDTINDIENVIDILKIQR